MSIGQDILDAVQKGGLNNWPTTTRHLPAHITRKAQNRTETAMDKIYNSIKGLMTATEIAQASGFKADATYKYLIRLIDAGMVVRSQRGQPHSYRRK
jgi:predicted transcriptional regulator